MAARRNERLRRVAIWRDYQGWRIAAQARVGVIRPVEARNAASSKGAASCEVARRSTRARTGPSVTSRWHSGPRGVCPRTTAIPMAGSGCGCESCGTTAALRNRHWNRSDANGGSSSRAPVRQRWTQPPRVSPRPPATARTADAKNLDRCLPKRPLSSQFELGRDGSLTGYGAGDLGDRCLVRSGHNRGLRPAPASADLPPPAQRLAVGPK